MPYSVRSKTFALALPLAMLFQLGAVLDASAQPDQVGTWGPVLDWGVQGKHMVLLPTGNLLLWPTGDNARVWNVATGALTSVPATFGDLHCAAQAMLPDGRTVVAGGQNGPPHVGIKITSLFDPFSNTWSQGAPMNYARWYSTVTVLPDGRLLVSSGDDASGNRVNVPEVYDPIANTWTVLTGANRSQSLYPFMYVLPNGKVFEAGSGTGTAYLDFSGAGSWTPGPTNSFGSNGYSECDAMYSPGKIMRTGGGDPAMSKVALIDMNLASPQWRDISPMAFPRRRHNLVILLDGTVMAVGGTRSSDSEAQAVLAGEIWNPTTEQWTTVAAMSEARMYHSSAVLLPDGRVVTAGGEASGRLHAQIYSPPYLYKGARPTITSSPATGAYAASFTINTPDAGSIDRVALLRPCASTHAIDMNERYVPLTFTSNAGSGVLTVTAPVSPNMAPPGYYMLVIRKSNGIPSVASWIRLGSTANLTPGTIQGRVTATGGGAISGVTVAYNGGSTTTNGTGDYVLSNVPPGEHGVTASKIGYGSVTTPVTVAPGATVNLDFQLSAPGSIAGRVTNRTTGSPIQGADVNYGGGAVATDAAGAYRIDGLAPGNHTLTVNAFGYQTSDSTVAVTSGAVKTLDFALEPEHPYIVGEVVDAPTSNPIVGATVSYSGGSTTTDNLGRYRLNNVAPGTYDVTAAAPEHISAIHQVVVGQTGYSASDFALELAPPQPGSTRTLAVLADADVKLGATTNNGTAATMRLRFGSPSYQSYLKFVVPSGYAQSAKLRLYCTDPGGDVGSVFRVSNGWTETGITGANAPPLSGNPVASGGAGAANTWIEYDVTAVVQAGDTVSFGLRSLSSNSAYFSTREGTQPPQLVVVFGTPVPKPVIGSFTPPSGPRGSVVTISGSGFSNATAVKFAGTAAVFTIDTDAQLRATVPVGASSGPISVTNPGGTGTSTLTFDVIPPPTVRFFVPASGPAGTGVYVHGNAFSSATALAFNGTTAGVLHVESDTLIHTVVPAGASSGPVGVTNPGGTGSSAQGFVVIQPPTISFIAPTGGPVSTLVEIHGTGLTTTSAVTLNGALASFTVLSDTLVRAAVPVGATSGPFGVSTDGGGATSGQSFTVNLAPLVSFFAPAGGPAGTAVDIHGRNFTSATGVAFNGTAAGFTIDSDTLVRAIVSNGTTSGRVTVTNGDGTGISATDFAAVAPPTVGSFTPGSGPVGTSVTITGTGFTGTTAVAFNSTAAAQFTVVNDTQLRATVPGGATSGKVRVTNPAGSGESGPDFTVIVSMPPASVSFLPVGDAYVDTSKPTTSYGTARDLRIRSTGPTDNSYLKFDVTGLSGAVQSAKLRLYCNNESVDGGRIYAVSNNYLGTTTPWVETGLNGNTAPALAGTPLQQKAAVTINTWVEFDVKAAILGNGTYSFGIASGSTNIAGYDSKEGTNRPTLVIETGTPQPPQPPAITFLTPTSGPPGTAVDVHGSGLSGVTAAAFNGVSSTSVTIVSDTLARATVPAGATTGPVSVTSPNGTATSSQAFTVTPAPPTSTWTFAPLADAHVNSGSTGNNYGSLSTLRARSTDYRFFLKFDVQGVTGPVSSAKVRLYVTDASPVGGSIFVASNLFGNSAAPWTESGVTWSSAPALSGGSLSTLGLVNLDTWVEFDVTSAVVGNGLVSFGVTSSNTNSVYYSSKEGAHPPVLEVRTGSLQQQAETMEGRPTETPSGAFEVRPARPNPFAGTTLIAYALPRAGHVRLTVYSVAGQVVSRLLDRDEAAGMGQVTWDGTDAHGRRASPGVYLYRLEYSGQARGGKLLLVR